MFGLGLLRFGLKQLRNVNDEKKPEINILGRLSRAMSQEGQIKNKQDEFDDTPVGDPLGTYNRHDDTFKW